MKLILLNKDNPTHIAYLKSALLGFQEEVFASSTEIDYNSFVNHHYAIYLIVSNNNELVGFSSFIINTYYGMRQSTVGNTYLFIEKEHRRSKAMHLISIQAGEICKELGFPLEHYIADGGGSEKFVGRLNGKKVYTTYEFGLNEVERETNRLKTKIKLKER